MKSIWGGVKKIISLKPTSCGFPSKVLKDGCQIIDTVKIANAFNEFFVGIGDKLANSVSPVAVSPISFMPTKKQNSMFFLLLHKEKLKRKY
jgi:hypothetical protein